MSEGASAHAGGGQGSVAAEPAAPGATALEPFEPVFLYTYLDASGQAVLEGQQTGDFLELLAVGLVAFALALLFFQRRNLTVGAWPWQRAQVS